jgi:hypothetical protein
MSPSAERQSACLRFHQSRAPLFGPDALKLRRPVFDSSVGRARHYAAHLAPLADALGAPAPSAG